MNRLDIPSGRLALIINESRARSSQLHSQFLRGRRISLDGLRELIEMQMSSYAVADPIMGQARLLHSSPQSVKPALFDSRQLEAFGRGQMSQCFGSEFLAYDGRRIPRIPNGDLRMMSRIVSIEGRRRDFRARAEITVEYDVPRDAWYFLADDAAEVPASLYMEIALQPCGFLSAYLDTYALVPHQEYFFRNLDGALSAVNRVDVRGKTLTTRARLVSNVASGGTVIQKFSFEMFCGEKTLFTGSATFGYFAAETMINQVGLDGGQLTAPALHTDAELAKAASWLDLARLQQGSADHLAMRLPGGRMHLIERAAAARDMGRYGHGYLYASRKVNPDDWFYPFHFFQDPVMPGSLGVEAVLETMQAGALAWGLGQNYRRPRFRVLPGTAQLEWRYRGQITPRHELVELEIHLKEIQHQKNRVQVTGDASVWVDGLRIYEVHQAAVEIEAA